MVTGQRVPNREGTDRLKLGILKKPAVEIPQRVPIGTVQLDGRILSAL